MPATTITLTAEGVHCSKCGLLEPDEHATSRNHGYNHLLDLHREELIAAHGPRAIERAEAR